MCRINYSDIVEKYWDVIKYCLKNSDSFSVITSVRRPYSKRKPVIEHEAILEGWKPYLIEQIAGIKEWPGTKTDEKHKMMNAYSSREFRKNVEEIPNLFIAKEYNLPEDICFYRKGEPWFSTTTHEEIAYMNMATNQDIEFMKLHNIRFYK